MRKVVTFLSTLRDPTHVRQWWCATRQQHPKYAPGMQEVCQKDEKKDEKGGKEDGCISMQNA